MESTIDILRNANLYSIEFAGYFNLKFTLPSKKNSLQYLNSLIVEFNSGYELFDERDNLQKKDGVFDLFGLNVKKSSIGTDGVLKIMFENDFWIKSVLEVDELVDRNWVIRTLDNSSYIINDANQIFVSKDLENFIPKNDTLQK